MFGLRVCDEKEWQVFSKHYDQATGEVTPFSPSELMSVPYDTPMTEGARDELSRTCAELTAANTTIKNLSEAVVNFSRTGNVSKTQEEDVGPTPQLPLMMTTPCTDATLAPRWVKSANPTVIKPTRNTTTVPQQPPAAMSNRPKANPHRLILQFNPPIPERERKNADIARKEINTLLDTLEVPMYFRVMAVNWSRNGNPIITTTASGMAKDLLSHSAMIGKIFTGNTLISALPDIEYFRAKVNMLSTKDFEGNVQNSVEIHGELMEYVLGYNKLRHASPPRWLGNQEYLDAKSHSSMVFSFTTAEDRDKFLAFSPIWVFNQRCTITRYKDRPHIFACQNCGSFAHKICDTPACLKCGGKDHATNTHPTNLPLHCINCRKEHASNYVNCNCRRRLLGLNPLPDTTETQMVSKKTSKNTGKKTLNKPKLSTSKEKTNTNQVIGLDGNQLLEAINSDNGETPLRLRVSSALHKKAQEQLNRSSQRLREKATSRWNTQNETQTADMEGVIAATPIPQTNL